MDRFDVISFSDLTGPDGSDKWVKIGGGSFGVVFKGEYLGTQVAIKEVLPNNTYDVEKYFERECVLMKEARHPNIVQYIGLTKSPEPDGRIYIISEFVGGNLRSFIADTRKAFPWRLRLSFATDIARALAYLHARNCMHRDLKGENLLITANDRIKVCDFGFARIAARNEEEMRRISYCGTDGYMSPEILMGIDFSLPSDIFSLGIIFCEILSRHLVDANTFKREMPSFGVNADEVYDLASDGCPPEFIQLALDCVDEDPARRPGMREVVRRLRLIESDVVRREMEQAQKAGEAALAYAVGSIRGSSLHAVMGSKAGGKQRKGAAAAGGKGGKADRHGLSPKMPSFSGQVDVKASNAAVAAAKEKHLRRTPSEDSTSSDDMNEAIAALEQIGIDTKDPVSGEHVPLNLAAGSKVSLTLRRGGKISIVDTIKAGSTFKVSGHGNPWWSDDERESLPSINASWIKGKGVAPASVGAGESSSIINIDATPPARLSSILTVKGGDKDADYSTSVIRSSKVSHTHAPLASAMSVLTARQQGESGKVARAAGGGTDASDEIGAGSALTVRKGLQRPRRDADGNVVGGGASSSNFLGQLDETTPQGSFMTARTPSLANATIASSIRAARVHADDGVGAAAEGTSLNSRDAAPTPAPLPHRFTLVKNGMKRPSNLTAAATAAASGIAGSAFGSLLPPAIMLTNALAKCWVCGKRIGWKPFLDCDDCPYKTHVACGELAEANCEEICYPPPRSGSSTPVVSAEQVAARRLSRSKSPDQMSVSAAAAALRAQMANSDLAEAQAQAASAGGAKEKSGGGLKLKLKRNSTSQPLPPSGPAILQAPAANKKGIRT
ncbi:kinase-like protein [Tilletiaria anomala UBC 951]|uniref:Kinase-like protein n=1 Tax=Tilletiaria anomala (strain ATCC 24038 / CBS 436.72 / UBC 951) TaxID=1037660 RepID=A0A066WQ91_TILAU|nr:kinase-like protein [Tilletiaria anomala UBC 951]KDN52790.1 kinase-like protein [Tilletiaria anomala UBC 951]